MICFVVNPAAGCGKAKAAVPILERYMREKGAECSFIYTQTPGDFARISQQVALGKVKAVACVGGDGTVQEYVGLTVNREIDFSVIPAGSGNDLLYSLPGNQPVARSFEEKIGFHAGKVLRGKTMPADIVAVNGERYFFNIGGTGIDIQVLRDAAPLKKTFGGAAYFFSLIKNVAGYRPQEVTLTIDGQASTTQLLLLAVCNGGYYGGGLRIAPPARIDDGFLTICRVEKMPRLKLMALFPLVKPGWHGRMREVSICNCKEVGLAFSGKKTINFDGNLYEFESPLTFRVLKGAVRLIV